MYVLEVLKLISHLCAIGFTTMVGCEEDQNRATKKVLLWHVDYFQLKAIKIQQTQEKFLRLVTYYLQNNLSGGLVQRQSFYQR